MIIPMATGQKAACFSFQKDQIPPCYKERSTILIYLETEMSIGFSPKNLLKNSYCFLVYT